MDATPSNLAAFKVIYIEELTIFQQTMGFDPIKYPPPAKVDAMIADIRRCAQHPKDRSDWLKHNPALHKAAKRFFGSKVKSAEVRAFIKDQPEATNV